MRAGQGFSVVYVASDLGDTQTDVRPPVVRFAKVNASERRLTVVMGRTKSAEGSKLTAQTSGRWSLPIDQRPGREDFKTPGDLL